MSTSKSLVLAFIWILLLIFIFMLFVYILGASGCKSFSTEADVLEWGRNINASGIYYAKTTTTGIAPASLGNVFVLSVYDAGTKTLIRTCAYQQDGTSIIQMNNSYNGKWQGWHDISIDFPSFYKNYQTLQSFAAACGIDQTSIKLTILDGEEEENPINTYFYLLEIKLNISSQTKRGLKFGLAVFSEPQLLYVKNTDTNVWKTIALSPLT